MKEKAKGTLIWTWGWMVALLGLIILAIKEIIKFLFYGMWIWLWRAGTSVKKKMKPETSTETPEPEISKTETSAETPEPKTLPKKASILLKWVVVGTGSILVILLLVLLVYIGNQKKLDIDYKADINITSQQSALEAENSILQTEISTLKAEKSALKKENSNFKAEISALKAEKSVLETELFSREVVEEGISAPIPAPTGVTWTGTDCLSLMRFLYPGEDKARTPAFISADVYPINFFEELIGYIPDEVLSAVGKGESYAVADWILDRYPKTAAGFVFSTSVKYVTSIPVLVGQEVKMAYLVNGRVVVAGSSGDSISSTVTTTIIFR